MKILLLLLVITVIFFILIEVSRLISCPEEAARVTVIVKDQEYWLEGFIQKIFNCIKNKPGIKILVVDDNSRDRTWEVLQMMQRRYPFELLFAPGKKFETVVFSEGESEYKDSFIYDVRNLKGRELLNSPLFSHLAHIPAGKKNNMSK